MHLRVIVASTMILSNLSFYFVLHSYKLNRVKFRIYHAASMLNSFLIPKSSAAWKAYFHLLPSIAFRSRFNACTIKYFFYTRQLINYELLSQLRFRNVWISYDRVGRDVTLLFAFRQFSPNLLCGPFCSYQN
jgi:hypothetical protein